MKLRTIQIKGTGLFKMNRFPDSIFLKKDPAMVDYNFTNSADKMDYGKSRMTKFGLSMVVLAVCLILYYLGFFGTYEGPLNPQNIGQTLDAWGLSKAHVAYLFMVLFVLLLIWNWLFNIISILTGKRFFCLVVGPDGKRCEAKVSRKKRIDAEGRKSIRYICENGHVSAKAHFYPVKKGPWGYCLCLAMALVSGMCVYWI